MHMNNAIVDLYTAVNALTEARRSLLLASHEPGASEDDMVYVLDKAQEVEQDVDALLHAVEGVIHAGVPANFLNFNPERGW
jgi:hypothetical protein